MSNAHRETRANYDRLSRWYDILSGSSEQTLRRRGLSMLDLQPGDRVLEIGCGTGESLPDLASRAGQVVGFDLSAGMLDVARKKLKRNPSPKAVLLQGDAARLPFAGKTFDAIFMSFTLELFPDAEIPHFLKECKRALRPGGRVGLIALVQSKKPGWMERVYGRVHLCWPRVIDCHPIPIEEAMMGAGFKIDRATAASLWGLAVGLLVASKPSSSGMNP